MAGTSKERRTCPAPDRRGLRAAAAAKAPAARPFKAGRRGLASGGDGAPLKGHSARWSNFNRGRRVLAGQLAIGLIGGLSWESSAEYYRMINQMVRARLGGLRSGRCLMWSFDFGEIEALQQAGRWAEATTLMIDAARRLERGGADFFLICSNTMHRMADEVANAVQIPLLHIADPTAERIKEQGIKRVGLLATAFTMEQQFYRGRLEERFGLEVIVPEDDDRVLVHRVIYDELVQGRIESASRDSYRRIIARLVDRRADAIILGCTEIMLLVKTEDCPVPLFDTTSIHAEAAVDRALLSRTS
jgi:aspartate racemase